jgi:UDP-glucose:(heptosyl)LPS alpha-1,3-glucosyltransferase
MSRWRRGTLARFYQFADAVVIPSLYDPFANVTVEALAMGLFVVSSKSNGGHEILTDKNGAIISNLFNRDSLTFALKEALRHPKTPMQALSIRESVRNLDYSLQTKKLIDSCGL